MQTDYTYYSFEDVRDIASDFSKDVYGFRMPCSTKEEAIRIIEQCNCRLDNMTPEELEQEGWR